MTDLFIKENVFSGSPSHTKLYSVSEITSEIKSRLEQGFPMIWVEGEISNFKRHSSGHLYFSLKDIDAQISCVMWRGKNQYLPFQPSDGMKIRVLGSVTVYARHGRYQLDVHQLRAAGLGELQLAFEALKKRLAVEGLFDESNKQPLPAFPKRIGVVTSPTGAAIRDIVSVISRRFPSAQIILKPVRVQGDTASQEIAQAIEELNEYAQVDVLIVGRGGGSLEDLWAFNEEVTARAIFNSRIPVVSAVGHEIDFTICDFVADMRVPTPSAAAELVVRNREELVQTVMGYRQLFIQQMKERITFERSRIDSIKRSYGLKRPEDRIRENHFRLDETSKNLETYFKFHLNQTRGDVTRLSEQLQSLDPNAVLKRGYSVTIRMADGHMVTRSSDLQERDKLRIQFAQGAVQSVVEDIEAA